MSGSHAETMDDTLAGGRHIPKGRDFLDRAEVAKLSSEELARRTAALAPLIASKAAKVERQRRPDPEVWSALRASGFFYQFVPKAFGGMGTDAEGLVDAALPIARACPSTAWNACFCAVQNRLLAFFPRVTQEELWNGDFPYMIAPMLGFPPGKAIPTDGGYRVSGTWSWGTGIMDADWVMGVALIADGGDTPRTMFALFPAAEAEVLDTWHVDGLAGSGSNDVRVDDLFVPESRTFSGMGFIGGATAESKRHPEPIFRAPTIAIASLGSAVPVLGAAMGALDAFRRQLLERADKLTKAKASESPVQQIRLAGAELAISTAEKLIRDAARKSMIAANIEGPDQIKLRIELRAQFAYATKLCRDSVRDLVEGGGSSMHRLDNPLQRFARDIDVMASHLGSNVDQAYELHGRTLLGLEPQTMLY